MATSGLLSVVYLIYFIALILINDVNCVHQTAQNKNSILSQKIRRRRLSSTHDDKFLRFRFLEEPSDSYAINGTVKLKCSYWFSPHSHASAHTDWFKDNALIKDTDLQIKLTRHQNISAEFVETNKKIGISGTYHCGVTVHDGVSSWTYLSRKASVQSPYLSRFEKEPINLNSNIGDHVAFECALSSYPRAEILWLHNNKFLNVVFDNSLTIYPVTSTLEISNVQLRHQGVYRCLANNGFFNRSSEESYLAVTSKATISRAPSFVLAPHDTVIKAGSSFLLECLINGVSQSEVRWWRSGRIIGVDGEKIRSVGTSSLLIKNVTTDDSGVYECRAGNHKLSRSAVLTVSSAPVIIHPPRDIVAQKTADAEFECIVAGNPGALVKWFKNGEAIITSEYFIVEGNRLRILGLVQNDQGVYQCIAENDVGSAQASAQLIVENSGTSLQLAGSNGSPKLPSEPLGLRFSNFGSRFVTLAWDQPLHSHGSIIIYHVYYKESDSRRERNANSSTTSRTITSLQPNTSYLFRVVAVNEAGPGKSSTSLLVTTSKEQAVPGKVRNLRAQALNSETIQVNWDPPVTDLSGTDVQNYILFYIQSNDAASERETQITTQDTSYVLRGMAKFTDYRIRVEAEGPNGPGLSSEVVTVRTYSDVPSGPPTNVRAYALSRNSLQVMWDPVRPEERNGEVTGYRLKYKSKHRNSKPSPVTVNKTTTVFVINGLDAGVEYSVRVAAMNVNGTGPNSDPIKLTTLLEDKDESHVPSSPQKLILHPSSRSILAMWDPPADPKVMVRKYKLGWGPSLPDIHVVDLDVDARNYTIKNLDIGREYIVSLRAVNKQGPGLPIYETATTPLKATMDSVSSASLRTPVEVRAKTLSSSAILVSWTDLNSPLSGARLYTVKCSSNSERSSEPRQSKVSVNEVIMEGLYPNTHYECVVRIDNGNFFSSWSMAATNRTFSTPPSSAPCDLTVNPSETDPHTITLSWQPPKYANGDINEYLIYYTHEPERPSEEWFLVTVEGNQMTYTITDLLPRTAYFFKVQARNVEGLGPLSKAKRFDPDAPAPRQFQAPSMNDPMPSTKFFSNPVYIGMIVVAVLLSVILIVLVIWCVRMRDTRKGIPPGYMAGKKAATDGRSPPDLWIDHARAHHIKDFSGGSPSISASDLKRIEGGVNSTIPPRYQSLQANGNNPSRRVSSALGTYSNSSLMMTQSAHEPYGHKLVGVAEAIPVYPLKSDCESNGTLTRSYHQSSSSLESRQRTPQVVYSGSSRYLPTAKVDYSDQCSSYDSSQALQSQTPPPQLPNQGPPSCPPSQISDGYRTLRGTPLNSSNPLKSFTQLAGAPPPLSPSQAERAAHVIRPVVIASPSSRGKPAGIVVGQKSSLVPIGRATAQPRVNVNNIYAYHTSRSSPDKAILKSDIDRQIEAQPLQQSESTEELMENLDTMIDDLQAMQHEFTASS